MALHELGARLREAGLSPRALAAWAGTDRLTALPARLTAHLPSRLAALATREPVPAAVALALFVAGAELEIDRLAASSSAARARAPRLPLDDLIAAGLLERSGQRVRAPVAVLPLGTSLLVCDRADAPITPELACWPDDSSYHLASAVPRAPCDRWLDLACGSAFAQLARRGTATAHSALDANPRAVRYANLGAGLSGLSLDVIAGDLTAACAPASRVTCNAPIPGHGDVTLWRTADAGFFTRLFAVLPERLVEDPASLAIVHARREALPDDLPGERAIVTYTPPGVAPAFAVLWWRPHAPERLVAVHRPLTPARPHVEASDRDDALAGLVPANADVDRS